MTVAVLLVVGAGAGVGVAVNADGSSSAPAGGPATTASGPAGARKHAGQKPDAKTKVDPARQAWAHTYGVDRATMANLADAASATPDQQGAATDLLLRTEEATAQYADLDKAKAAGFDVQADLAKKEKESPGEAAKLQRIDAGKQTDAKMPMLHVGNKANKTDGKVLDPSAPETLMYSYQGDGHWTLVGVMYTANESYPQAPPDPGGPITRWHYHEKSGGQRLMMHIFFVPGNDLSHAYAAEMVG
ncbi:MAG: hypothetical protein M3011_03100 [Actinomycetota bacterium]|nr:hypothetical protein [Actinomycetota bacterium]